MRCEVQSARCDMCDMCFVACRQPKSPHRSISHCNINGGLYLKLNNTHTHTDTDTDTNTHKHRHTNRHTLAHLHFVLAGCIQSTSRLVQQQHSRLPAQCITHHKQPVKAHEILHVTGKAPSQWQFAASARRSGSPPFHPQPSRSHLADCMEKT